MAEQGKRPFSGQIKARTFNSLDLNAVIKDMHALMTDSQGQPGTRS